jgi:hypothetical protein
MTAARNRTRSSDLASDVEVADSVWGKFKGLMGRSSLPVGAALWLPESNGIHMMFMRFPIDAVFLGAPAGGPLVDGARPVVSVHRALRAWTGLVSAVRTGCWSCRSGRSMRPARSSGISSRSASAAATRAGIVTW